MELSCAKVVALTNKQGIELAVTHTCFIAASVFCTQKKKRKKKKSA
jgi:hypothetical protein